MKTIIWLLLRPHFSSVHRFNTSRLYSLAFMVLLCKALRCPPSNVSLFVFGISNLEQKSIIPFEFCLIHYKASLQKIISMNPGEKWSAKGSQLQSEGPTTTEKVRFCLVAVRSKGMTSGDLVLYYHEFIHKYLHFKYLVETPHNHLFILNPFTVKYFFSNVSHTGIFFGRYTVFICI